MVPRERGDRGAGGMADAAATGARGMDAAAIAHDLANLVAAIGATCALLDDDLERLPLGSSANAAREGVPRIALAAERAGELCDRLRVIPAPAAATRPLATRSHDLAATAREACALVAPALPGGATLRFVSDGAAPLPVRGAALDAFQVVLNLAVNAAEAAGGGTVRAGAGAWVADRTPPLLGRLVPGRTYARLWVEDDGPGLPADAARLFERGVTGSNEAGRGTGLFTVAAIAEGAGGAVLAARSPTGGGRIEVAWPLHRPRADLSGACVLVIAGHSGPTARLADALDAAGAEPSLCLDPDDAVASLGDDPGAWDAVAVAGPARGLAVDVIAERIARAGPRVPCIVIGGACRHAVPAGASGAAMLDALARAMADAAGSAA